MPIQGCVHGRARRNRPFHARHVTIFARFLEELLRRVFARGLRNAVGVGIHPVTNEIWVTNNGLDKMGTMLPPESVRIVRDGSFHGWPIAYGHGVWIDYDNFYRDERMAHTAQDSADIASMYPPVGLLPAHTAPMASDPPTPTVGRPTASAGVYKSLSASR